MEEIEEIGSEIVGEEKKIEVEQRDDDVTVLSSSESAEKPPQKTVRRNSLMMSPSEAALSASEAEQTEMVELKPAIKKDTTKKPTHRKTPSQTLFSADELEKMDAELARAFRDEQEASQTEEDERSTSRTSTLDLSQSMRNKFKTERKAKTGNIKSKALLKKRLSRQLTRSELTITSANEDLRLEQALERSWQAANIRKLHAIQTDPIKNKMASPLEQFDFFTKIYAQEPSTEIAAISSRDQVANSSKVDGEISALEDDGEFTGDNPSLSNRQKNTLEHRLLKEKLATGKDWFRKDGSIIQASAGLAKFHVRPDLLDSYDLVQFAKAVRGRRVTADGVYQLDVNISKIMFTHHPLFSTENVLTSLMLQYFQAYYLRTEANAAQYYNFKLQALRREWKSHVNNNENAEEGDKEKNMTMLNQIQQIRQQRDNEEFSDRKLLQSMLKTWKALKITRDRQNYNTTSFQLLINKREVDSQEYKKELAKDLKEELEERECFYKLNHDGNMQHFDNDAVWREIIEKATSTRRSPGEPIYTPVMESSASITPIDSCPKGEKDRRNNISKHSLYFRIYFNELEVCKTISRPLNADFCVNFAQIYSLHVFEWPRSITLKIYEKDAEGVWSKLAETGLEVPSLNQVVSLEGQEETLNEVNYSSPTTVTYSHAAVGSGEMVNFDGTEVPGFIARTSGVIKCSALWGRAKDNTPLSPPSQPGASILHDRIMHLDPTNAKAVQEVRDLINKTQLDPNDPANSQVMAYIKSLKDETPEGEPVKSTGFRLEPEQMALISQQEFDNDVRMKLIELRSQGVPEFRGMKMIPPYSREIPADIFKDYEKRIERERENRLITDVDALRDAGNKYISMIRAEVVQRLGASHIQKSVQDVVSEAPLPSFGATLRNLFVAQVDRDLKPMRNTSQRVGPLNLTSGQVKILVNVQAAINVPVRIERGDDGPEVEPMVEVSVQGKWARTSVVASANPVWQQMLTLDFDAPNDDYSPATLRTVTDVIYVHLFDQLVSPLPKDDREGNATVHEQLEKRWLGTVQLPFSTLYLNGRVDGTFRLRRPPVFLDYHKVDSHTYIKLLLAIEPALQTPDTFTRKFNSIESESLVQRCEDWARQLTNKFPHRRYIPLVLDSNGRRVLVSRYLKSLQPPDEVVVVSRERPRQAADMACNIVCKIPFVADAVIFPGMVDIWSTCDEFLNMLCGDEEEHAILLYCWLVGMQIQCALLIGSGLPEGPRSAYVLATLTEEGSQPTNILYNASDGAQYSIDDSYCPFRSVACIVTPDNVYGNIQENEHPSCLNYDTSRLQDWTPLFSKSYPNPGLGSIQPETLEYTATDSWNVVNLRDRLDREIKAQFYQWRPTGIPNWNLSAQETFRQIMPLLETGRMSQEEHMQRLKPLTEAYRMSGFPLNMGYESMHKIIQAVRATNVHMNYNEGVQFALAVHVHAYTNNILSVWIYIASLIRHDQSLT